MNIIDVSRDGTVYHIRCNCGESFWHRAADGAVCTCPVCRSKELLRELLNNMAWPSSPRAAF